MKVAIITISDYDNYGNRLQNYALQKFLENQGHEVTTIVNSPVSIRMSRIIALKSGYNTFKKFGLKGLLNKINEKKNIDKKNALSKKRSNFIEFSKEYITESNYSINPSDIPEHLAEEYDYFIVGSDQVWNPNFRHMSPIDFLTFANKNQRIAYAPSFGVSNIEKKYKKKYATWLNGIEKISIREESGQNLIQNLTDHKVPILVDPTMLISKEDWITLSKEYSGKPQKKYLLTYYLGELSKEKQIWIEQIARENELEILKLADYNNLKEYSLRPDEFIDLISSATLFLTDSFHGTIFSIIMNTPFVVFDRISHVGSMSSRIDTLLRKFEFENRKWEKIKYDNVFDIDFSKVTSIQKIEKNKSISFIEKAIDE